MAVTDSGVTTKPMINVHGLGIQFKRNRRQRRSFKDLFAGRGRRAKPDEFWALRNVAFSVAPGEAIGVVGRNVEFSVAAGEAIGVVGRNGQGKSTLLKLVAEVMIPDEGSVTVNGGVAPLIEITGGFVDDLSVRENIYLTAGLHGMSKREINERFDEIIDFAEIGDFVDTPYKHLSSGMRVRVAFAVISRLEEPILLVDEVLAVGDRQFKEKCYSRIDEMLSSGRTMFFVSHSEKDLLRFCKRGLYLDKGELVLDGPIQEVVDRYNSDYNSKA